MIDFMLAHGGIGGIILSLTPLALRLYYRKHPRKPDMTELHLNDKNQSA